MKKKIFISLLIILVAMQFIRPAENKGQAFSKNDITHFVQVPDSIRNILTASCYDCHSNHTNYPWYAKVNPVGWWLNNHIEEGKAELNFSDFSTYSVKKIDHKLEETAEEVKEGHMPLPNYLWVHADAKLSEAQVNQLVHWVNTERQRLAISK